MTYLVNETYVCDCLDCEDAEHPCTGDCDECIGCIEAKADAAEDESEWFAMVGLR